MRLGPRLRTLLVLGRVSNLPTVWSNCLAAWLLGGAGDWRTFAQLGAGASLLYTGGMFLNDACDARFDRQYRPERPIPAGQISRKSVALLGAASLVAGWLSLAFLGMAAALFALVLAAVIVAYDTLHKQLPAAPWLMATCRFLLYPLAASTAAHGVHPDVWWRAGALAAYVAGISFLARTESRPSGGGTRWPLALLLLPLAVALGGAIFHPPPPWFPGLGLGAWIAWCLRGLWRDSTATERSQEGAREQLPPRASVGLKPDLGRGVSGLLAGIALVDWLATGEANLSRAAVFVALWLLALALQRLVPAT